jgi:hypothetical protein
MLTPTHLFQTDKTIYLRRVLNIGNNVPVTSQHQRIKQIFEEYLFAENLLASQEGLCSME